MKVLVFGKNGNISKALGQILSTNDSFSVACSGKDQSNFENPRQVLEVLDRESPHCVINAAAYTSVDRAEQEPELAFRINAETPGIIAKWCAENSSTLVHYSTDYVFSGSKGSPYTEDDDPNPINVYGKSKLAGEIAIQESSCKHLILRTSWIFAPEGNNFFMTMLRLGLNKDTVSIVNDQIGSPTYSRTIASLTVEAIKRILKSGEQNSGVFQITNSGATTWYGFATEIFAQLRSVGVPLRVKEVLPILSSEYNAPAVRPLDSRMNTTKFTSAFAIQPPKWELMLKDCIANSSAVNRLRSICEEPVR